MPNWKPAPGPISTPGTAPSDSFEYGPGWEEEDRYFYPDELWADTDGEEYRAARDRVLAERRQNLDIHLWTLEDVLEHYEISSETWDNRVNETTRSLMQESEDEFGRTVPAMTDREEAWELAFHMEHTSLRRRLSLDHNRDPDSYWGLGDDLARIWEYGRVRAYYDDRSEGSVTGALLSPLDEALDYLRSIGLDPGAIDVTVYGECLRHSHALDVFCEKPITRRGAHSEPLGRKCREMEAQSGRTIRHSLAPFATRSLNAMTLWQTWYAATPIIADRNRRISPSLSMKVMVKISKRCWTRVKTPLWRSG